MIVRLLSVVLGAFGVIVVLVVATRVATTAAFGVTPGVPMPVRWLLINVLAAMVAAGIGGYLCARRAPEGRVTIAAGLLLGLFFAIGLIDGRTAATPTEPLWYQAVAALLGVCGLLSGVVVGASRRVRH